MSIPADGFRSSLLRPNRSVRSFLAYGRIFLMIAFAGLVCTGTTTAAIQENTTGSETKAAPPTGAAPASGSPSLACTNASDAATAFAELTKISPTLPQIRVASRLRFLPLNSDIDVLTFSPFETESKSSFRIFLLPDGEDAKLATRAIDSTQVRVEAASKGTDGTNGTDFKYAEDTSAKTLIHFTPPGTTAALWQHARVYVVSCLGGVPQRYGQFETVLTSQSVCRALAILIAAGFYLLAAFATFFIHRSQRVYTTKDDIENHKVNGTNYASILHHLNPVVLTAGGNGRGSATKLQILFFSLVIFGLVSYIWMSTGYLSDLSQTVLLLMGISGLGATASAATDVAKTRLDFNNWAWLVNRRWLPKGGVAEVNRAQWKDIVMTDGEFDVYRFQMITFSVLVGMALLGAGGKMGDLSTFTIPGALLGIVGLSQVVYVAGKLVAPPSISQLNDQLDVLRKAEGDLQTALTKQELSAASSGLAALPLYRDELASRVGDSFDKYMAEWETARTMFESTLSREVSAVAEGCRPPFPYLSSPAEVMTILESRFTETDKKLTTLETALNAEPRTDAAINMKIEAIKAARAAFQSALQLARESLAIFTKQVKDSEDQPADVAADIANKLAKDKAKSEAVVRNALDLVRRRLDQLNQRLVP